MTRLNSVLSLVALLGLALAAVPNPRADCPSGHSQFSPKQWTYGADKVTAWGSICGAYAACNAGSKQSPIDIPHDAPKTSNLEISYSTTRQHLIRVDQVVSLPITDSPIENQLTFQGYNWTLDRLEFHSPSEHTIDGQYSMFEIQFYHSRFNPQTNMKEWTAIAVLYDAHHNDNKALASLVPRFPRVTTCECNNGRTENWDSTIFNEQCDCGALNNATSDGGCRPTCLLASCGDSIIDSSLGEECDNGALFNGDAGFECRANCTKPTCGDNIVDSFLGEQCDIGWVTSQPQTAPYFICDSFCHFSCGNGIIDPYMNTSFQEECDLGTGVANGNSDLPDAICREDCTLARCGDGIVDSSRGEECDAGTFGVSAPRCTDPANIDGICYGGWVNGPNPGQYSQNCRAGCILATCGDGLIDSGLGEECDTGRPDEPTSPQFGFCNMTTCTLRCGDGILDQNVGGYTEECDNGPLNGDGPSACRSNCQIAECGDGITDLDEQCDDGPLGTYMCTSACQFRCGNGFVDGNLGTGFPAEACDNGPEFFDGSNVIRLNGNSDSRANACRNNCQRPTCGDSVTDGLYGEQCDNGVANSDTDPNACRLDCHNPCCGDGVTDNGEECDHGHISDPTTLSALSPGNNPQGNAAFDNWGCGSDCTLLCGDGVRGDWIAAFGAGEQCDDGQLNSDSTPDKCRLNCRIHGCGDGVVDYDEECDDGASGSEVCTSTCKRRYCGDGTIDRALGEECDNGADNSFAAVEGQNMYTGCSPICTLNRCGLSEDFHQQELPSLNLYDLLWASPKMEYGNWKPSPARPGNFFFYEGSWTRPPCTENVNWLVLSEKQTIGHMQLEVWWDAIGPNSRPTQHVLPSRIISNEGIPPYTPQCGNGIREYPEQCDQGLWNDDHISNRCRKNCVLPSCGDGIVDQGEECDGESWCSPLCERSTMINGHVTDYNNSWSCPYWSYDWSHLWGDMEGEGCAACHGHRQSPINIPTECEGQNLRPLNLNHPSNLQYVDTPVVLFNTGNNIYFPTFNGGTFSFHGKTYVLQHLEFHHPSEHTIGGKRFDFEVQLHHQAQNPGVEQKAVLAILFEKGDEPNSFLDKFWNVLPPTSECVCGNGIKEDQYYWPDGKITKEECDAGHANSDVLPNSCRTNCLKPHCGDGVVDTNEACDMGSGNGNYPSHCREDCTEPFCGDGVVDLDEECDDGNGNNIDYCDNMCKWTCGNGVLEGLEECDDGAANSATKANACRDVWGTVDDMRVKVCISSTCGDGIIDVGEECDDGEMNSNVTGNACRVNCVMPSCGDGVTDSMNDEECDGGDHCTNLTPHWDRCTLLCGNGKIDGDEECDEGPSNSDTTPNACRRNCHLPVCGDGVRDSGEQCDSSLPFGEGPGQQINCWNCQVYCGNGFLEQDIGPNGVTEECDHGILNNLAPNACRPNCELPKCGDGILDTEGPCFEECDDGSDNAVAPNACRPNCRLPVCGDGVTDMGEECDDGNKIDGDGCSCNCQKSCGNGRVDEGEQCDDGNNNGNLPGCCRENCELPFCGDGITDVGEECDDGAMNKNAPNTCREDCTFPKCGDGYVDHMFGEKCDLGHLNSELSVDGCSPRCTPNVCGQSLNPDIMVTPHEVIPNAPGVYCYDGSVNHPPCTEDAQWFVFAAPQSISQCQLNQWARIIGVNNRQVQPLNGRTVSFLTEEARCGDGLVEGNEECDNGAMNSDYEPNACRRNCRKAYCGDGVQDATEQCDGTPNCATNCRLSCPAGSSCPNCNASQGAASGDSNVVNVFFGEK